MAKYNYRLVLLLRSSFFTREERRYRDFFHLYLYVLQLFPDMKHLFSDMRHLPKSSSLALRRYQRKKKNNEEDVLGIYNGG